MNLILFLIIFLCFSGELYAQQLERDSAKVEIEYQCDSITPSTIVTVIDNKIVVHDPDKSPLSLISPEKIESVKITNNYNMVEHYKKLKGLKIMVVTLKKENKNVETFIR